MKPFQTFLNEDEIIIYHYYLLLLCLLSLSSSASFLRPSALRCSRLANASAICCCVFDFD